MRRITPSLFVVTALFALTLAGPAHGLGLRLGNLDVVKPDTDAKFSIGVDNDTWILPILSFNQGSLFSFDGDSLYIDGYLGVKMRFDVIAERLAVTVRGNFMLKYLYPFEDNVKSGLALGGIVGPGVLVRLSGPLALSFEVDVQIYNFVYPDAYDAAPLQVALAFLAGLRF